MKKLLNKGKVLITYLSIFSVLAASMLSVFVGVDFNVVAETSPAVWDGSTADTEWAGLGTEDSPYIISTAAEVYGMITSGGNGKSYKIADGVTALYFNNVEGMTKEEATAFFTGSSAKNSWTTSQGTWSGTFDGNEATLYGLYSVASSGYNAFINIVAHGSTAILKNVNFDLCYFANTAASASPWNNGSGVVFGKVGATKAASDPSFNTTTATATVKNVKVSNSTATSHNGAAILYGCAINASLGANQFMTVNNDFSSNNASGNAKDAAALVVGGAGWACSGTLTNAVLTENCAVFPMGKYITNFFGNVNATYIVGTYFENEGTSGWLVKLTQDQMKGEAAKTNMPGLAWGKGWVTVANDYPDMYYYPDPSEALSASSYAGGTGTGADPYIIKTAGQLHKMVKDYGKDASGNPANFKIADGVSEIVINDIPDFSAATAVADENWINWMSELDYDTRDSKNGKTFVGTFDGNGATIKGLYAHSTSSNSVAFIPSAGTGAIVKNVSFESAYVKNDVRGAYEGAAVVIGRAYEKGADITISRVAVRNCFVSGSYAGAGFIGNTRAQTANISDCLLADCNISGVSNTGGAIADGWGTVNVSNSVFIGTHAERSSTPYSPAFSNCYCDDTTWSFSNSYGTVTRADGVEQLGSADDIKGEAAKTNMPELIWEEYGEPVWQITEDGYPVPCVSVSFYGTPGEAWSGKFADGFKSGVGTAENPYIIETAESLAYAIVRGIDGAYYELSEDIYLNDVTDDNWYEAADVNKWFSSADVTSFTGKLNGKNHTIYGLYIDAPAGTTSGLVPVIGSGAYVRNLTFADAYIKGAADATVGTVAGSTVDNASPSSIAAIDVLDSVQIVSGANAGGIIGYIGLTSVRINNVAFKGSIDTDECASYGGIVAKSDGAAIIKSSFVVDVYAFGAGLYSVTDIYSNIKHKNAPYNDEENIISLKDNKMKGDDAKENMTALDWDNIWQVNADAYPSVVGEYVASGGAVGEVWSGEVAANWAGGSGTEEDPYLIETAEQLAKFAKQFSSGSKKYYALTADIYLNDVDSVFWEQGIGQTNWLVRSDVFNGEIDGRGHVIYGLYYNYENDSSNIQRVGFISQMGAGAVIKNLGFSHSVIIGRDDTSNLFTGGIVGVVTYNSIKGKDPNETITGSINGTQVPVIENCFVDHNSTIKGSYVGGIVCAPISPVIVKDCFATCKLISNTTSSAYGAIIGDAWESGSVVINCFGSTRDADPFCSGTAFTSNANSTKSIITGSYTFSLYSREGVTKLKLVEDRLGERARELMAKSEENPDGLDFENIWLAVDEGTPVLRAFVNTGHAADEFSDKNFSAPQVTVTLQTDCDIVYEPLTGDMYSKLELPTPTREGYKFAGWYIYSDYQCEYDYGYYPPRDLNLYAKWEQVGIIQNFENYSNSKVYDYDDTKWVYNRPGAKGGYKVDYNHGGSKSMHRLNTEGEADVVINYKDPLVVGQEYSMTFWVASDEVGTTATISLVHNTWPDYLEPTLGVEKMVELTGLAVGEWVQYKYTFTATTPWISFRTTGNASLYLDDIIITPIGEIVENKNDYTYKGTGVYTTTSTTVPTETTSPQTGETATPVVAVVVAIIACAIVVMVSKRNLVEVIKK